MTIDECVPGQKLDWQYGDQGYFRAARVLDVTETRVIVLAQIKGQTVRRAVRPSRLYRNRKSAMVQL